MSITQQEFDAIISDNTKIIAENIVWRSDSYTTKSFRCEIESNAGYPIFVDGWYGPDSEKLSYSIVYRGVGRIYGLDLGADHRNPDGKLVGEKHKNYWVPGHRDRWAYVPEDITAQWTQPGDVWSQFCAESRIVHDGSLGAVNAQKELAL